MEQRKDKCFIYTSFVFLFSSAIYVIPFFMCRKKKLRKNTINGWFSKEASTSTPEQLFEASTSTPEQPTTSPSHNVDVPK
jgi:hypothetical protein